MGNFQFSGTFSTCPDPMDTQPFAQPEIGAFLNGKPAYQGWESAIIKFPPLTPAEFLELNSRWVGANATYQGGVVPYLGNSGWQNISAWWHQPLYTGLDGYFHHGTTMLITKVVRY
jgi:hypothetical protein